MINLNKRIMEFTREGLWFAKGNDEILWYWPWAKRKELPENGKYYSLTLNLEFDSFKEYEVILGGHYPDKVHGFLFQDILFYWISTTFRRGCFVVLTDINVSSKSNTFWGKIPSHYKAEMVKDIITLTCKDRREVVQLCNSINTDFAKAFGVVDGFVYYTNED